MKNIYSLMRDPFLVAVPVLIMLSFFGSIGCRHTDPEPDITLTYDADYRLVIPQTTTALTIDGSIAETAWSNDAFKLNLVDGSDVVGAEMRGVADASNIYLYFDIDESGFNNTDTLVIAFNPSSDPNDYHLLLIKPCETGTSGCQGVALPDLINPDIDYFTGIRTGNIFTWTDVGGVGGVTAQTTTSGTTRWMVEVSIPRGAPFNFPASKYFGLYTNIIPTDGFADSAQYTWPFVNEAGTNLIYGNVDELPSASVWGNATLSTSIGNGVRISSRDISTNHGPSAISWNEPNIFYAQAHNNTLTSGTLETANDVRATFKWANFGLPSHSSFQKIPLDATPATGNPTAYEDILATHSHTYQLNWDVPDGQEDFYKTNKHWCIKVELDSTDPGTVFYRQSAQRNMDFVETSSPFDRKATVATQGYRLPEGRQQHEIILEERFYNTSPEFTWSSTIEGAEKIAASKYRVKINQNNKAILGLSVLPPEIAIPREDVVVMPGDGLIDSYTQVAVQPGQLVTVISEGTVRHGTEQPRVPVIGAGGVALSRTEAETYLFSTVGSKYVRAGALVGSWDNFKKTSFLIGTASSFKVPNRVTKLSLAVNGKIGDQQNQDSQAYKVRVIATDHRDYHLAGGPSSALSRLEGNRVALGANLPTVIYRGKRNTGKAITIDGKAFKVYAPVGSFGFIVKGKE